jgi:hypothetical protein
MPNNLTVACKANSDHFTVKVPNGTVIQNFKGKAIPMKAGVVQTTANNGHVTNYYRQEKTEYKTVQKQQSVWQKVRNFVTTGKTGKTEEVPYQTVDKELGNQSALNLSSAKYNIFDKVRGLDKNPKDLSAKDLEVLRKSPTLWKQMGISAVKYDAKTKTTGIYTSAGDKHPFIIEMK